MNRRPIPSEWTNRAPDLVLARKLNIGVLIVTAVVLALAGAMRSNKFALPEGISTAWLPSVYSALNVFVAGSLVLAWRFIRQGRVERHRNAIHVALCGSGLFLLLYVVYHFTNEEAKFGGTGFVRIVYFALLISHILLAAASLPFILHTWVLGVTGQFARHRRLARFVFPVWLYVAITGPVCYLMLKFWPVVNG